MGMRARGRCPRPQQLIRVGGWLSAVAASRRGAPLIPHDLLGPRASKGQHRADARGGQARCDYAPRRYCVCFQTPGRLLALMMLRKGVRTVLPQALDCVRTKAWNLYSRVEKALQS